jgi:outer membrane cobalamin receptor
MMTIASLACTRASNRPESGDRDTITEAEIASSSAANAYEAVQRLRGNFLSNRGKTTILGKSSPMPIVYLDGVRFGEISSLRNISATTVQAIRLYRSWEAQQKYGNDVMGGVIEVTTKQ